MDQPLVYIIVLNWNGRYLLDDCLQSLKNVSYENFKILLVDNASTDDSVEFVKNEYLDIELLILDHNYGYAIGNNRGFNFVVNQGAEFVIFLNNDTFVDENFIRPLLDPFKDESIGQTVPKVYYADDREKIWYAGGKINFWTGNTYHQGIRETDSEKYNKIKETDYATGCCFCIRAEDFTSLNGFDESFRMYGQDSELSLRLRRKGQKVYFIPESKIYHKVSASIGGAFSLSKIKRKTLANVKIMLKYALPYQWLTQLIYLPILVMNGLIKYFKYK